MPSAKRIILGLLLAREGAPLTASEAIDACALFHITENNVRVTLARLRAEGLIESRERGSYVFGASGRNLAEQVFTWHQAETQLREWNGRYVMASLTALGRSDRRALAQRERALNLLGMRELERGLYLRPDNLAGGAARVRERLHALGLDARAPVFLAEGFDADTEARVEALWDRNALNRGYRDSRVQLEKWLAQSAALPADVAARESYLLGAAAIRKLVYDPWLPSEWIDAAARHAFLETVERFDAAGKRIWNGLRGFSTGMPVAPAAQLTPNYAT